MRYVGIGFIVVACLAALGAATGQHRWNGQLWWVIGITYLTGLGKILL